RAVRVEHRDPGGARRGDRPHGCTRHLPAELSPNPRARAVRVWRRQRRWGARDAARGRDPDRPGHRPGPGAPLWRRELVLPRGRVGAALGGLAGVRLLPTGGVRARGVVRRGTGAESGRRVQLPPHPPRRTRAADADRASLLRGPYVAAAAVAHVFPVRLFQATRRAQGGARDDAAAARPEPVPHGLGGEWPGRPLVATRGL